MDSRIKEADPMIPLISVVVPVFNKRLNLDRCLRSILAQRHDKLELILVDDGSTDGSSLVCDKFADIDGRVKVIHTKNGGVSHARNQALDICKGDYIAFVDADDYVSPNYLERLLSHSSDFSVCGYRHVTAQKVVDFRPGFRRLSCAKEVIDSLSDDYYKWCQVVWAKLYRAEIIREQSIRFNEGTIVGEDIEFNIRYAAHTRTGVVIDEVLYNNVISEGTLSRTITPDLWRSMENVLEAGHTICAANGWSDTFANLFVKRVKATLYQECRTSSEDFARTCERIKGNKWYSSSLRRIFKVWSYDHIILLLLDLHLFHILLFLVRLNRRQSNLRGEM